MQLVGYVYFFFWIITTLEILTELRIYNPPLQVEVLQNGRGSTLCNTCDTSYTESGNERRRKREVLD